MRLHYNLTLFLVSQTRLYNVLIRQPRTHHSHLLSLSYFKKRPLLMYSHKGWGAICHIDILT